MTPTSRERQAAKVKAQNLLRVSLERSISRIPDEYRKFIMPFFNMACAHNLIEDPLLIEFRLDNNNWLESLYTHYSDFIAQNVNRNNGEELSLAKIRLSSGGSYDISEFFKNDSSKGGLDPLVCLEGEVLRDNLQTVTGLNIYYSELKDRFFKAMQDMIRAVEPTHFTSTSTSAGAGGAGSAQRMRKKDEDLNLTAFTRGSIVEAAATPSTSTKVIRVTPASLYKFTPLLTGLVDTAIQNKVPNGNQFRTIGVNYTNEDELADVMKAAIFYAAREAGISDSDAIEAIKYAKFNGGVSNKYNSTTNKYEVNEDAATSEGKKKFSGICQNFFQKVGLHTGREESAKAVGMRTFRIPDWIVDELQKEIPDQRKLTENQTRRADLFKEKAAEYARFHSSSSRAGGTGGGR